MKKPVQISVSGAAGNIGYALVFRIAAGQMLGEDQPVVLKLLEVPQALPALRGVLMELEDCAFPLLHDLVATDDLETGFADVDYALLVGSKPRSKGMERKDLIAENARIFTAQGKAINAAALRSVRVLVVGNPANTNALIAAANAPDIDPRHFTAMTRLDHNRALAQIAKQTKKPLADIKKMIIWGNHSLTQYPDIRYCLVDNTPASELLSRDWVENQFIPTVQKRGAAVIETRGGSSAASAASAVIDHMHNWVLGTPTGDWVSMSVASDGNPYGIEPGLVYSFPVTCQEGQYHIVDGLDIDPYSLENIKRSQQELIEERQAIASLL